VGRVVTLDEVLDNGAGSPEGEDGVGIVNGGDAPVGLMARCDASFTWDKGMSMIL
jgi:hypothetical protein